MAFLKKLSIFIILLFGLALGAWVVLDNPEPVQLTLLGFPVQTIPAGIWLLLAILGGFLLGLAASAPGALKQRTQIKYLQTQLVKTRQKTATHAPK